MGSILNSITLKTIVFSLLCAIACTACLSLPKSKHQVDAKYSHTELSSGKHYLAYSGVLEMSLESAYEKWLAKAEKLCKSREFDHEIDKEEFRGKDFSDNKYPYIEGKLFCNKSE